MPAAKGLGASQSITTSVEAVTAAVLKILGEGILGEEVPEEEMAVEVPGEEMAVEEVLGEEMAVEEVPGKEMAMEKVPREEMPMEKKEMVKVKAKSNPSTIGFLNTCTKSAFWIPNAPLGLTHLRTGSGTRTMGYRYPGPGGQRQRQGYYLPQDQRQRQRQRQHPPQSLPLLQSHARHQVPGNPREEGDQKVFRCGIDVDRGRSEKSQSFDTN